jgi:hypothetical protein
MTHRESSSEALIIGAAFIKDVGTLFPATMKLTGGRLDFTFVIREDQLGHRTSGPYTPENPPTDVIQWANLRSGISMAGRFPRFSIDAGGQWARIFVELLDTTVGATIVMPEEITAESLNATHLGLWQDQVPVKVRMVLQDLAGMLGRCEKNADAAEPLIDLKLAYHRHPGYEKELSAVPHAKLKEFIAPVRPVLEMRWRAATPAQRKAFTDELSDTHRTGRWPRRRLTAQIMGMDVELAE